MNRDTDLIKELLLMSSLFIRWYGIRQLRRCCAGRS